VQDKAQSTAGCTCKEDAANKQAAKMPTSMAIIILQTAKSAGMCQSSDNSTFCLYFIERLQSGSSTEFHDKKKVHTQSTINENTSINMPA
jgi:hypothetical protein